MNHNLDAAKIMNHNLDSPKIRKTFPGNSGRYHVKDVNKITIEVEDFLSGIEAEESSFNLVLNDTPLYPAYQPIKKIVCRVKEKHPEIPIIVFPRLAGERYIKIAEIEGVSAVSLDQTISLNWAKKALQSKVTVQGNLDPVYLLAGGKVMRDEIARILKAFNNGPFVFNLGHGVLPTTPIEHVSELCEFISDLRELDG